MTAHSHKTEGTITITSLVSQTPSQFIDVDTPIFGLVITGDVLLVVGSEMHIHPGVVSAWVLTEEGPTEGVFESRRRNHTHSIWTVPGCQGLRFSVEGENGVIESDGDILHVYNTRTGEVLKPAKTPLHLCGPWYDLADMKEGQHHLYNRSMHGAPPRDDWKPSQVDFEGGWIKGSGGEHLLWLPVEWRTADWDQVKWFPHIATIQFKSPQLEDIIIKLRK